MYIKQNLKHYRELQKWSTLKLSQSIGINESILRRIESGETKDPHISTLNKITHFFNISLDDFVNKDLTKKNLDKMAM